MFQNSCLQARSGGVVVDLEAVSYIDSSGIASLVEAFQKARQQGTPFGLAVISPAVRRVMRLLESLDAACLDRFPSLRRHCGEAVIVCRR